MKYYMAVAFSTKCCLIETWDRTTFTSFQCTVLHTEIKMKWILSAQPLLNSHYSVNIWCQMEWLFPPGQRTMYWVPKILRQELSVKPFPLSNLTTLLMVCTCDYPKSDWQQSKFNNVFFCITAASCVLKWQGIRVISSMHAKLELCPCSTKFVC